MDAFYKNFSNLVEDTYRINNNSRVLLVAHSMGNPVTLYFLNHQSQAWKEKYIQGFVTLAGVWGGAVKTLRLMASGMTMIFLWEEILGQQNKRTQKCIYFKYENVQFGCNQSVYVNKTFKYQYCKHMES